MKKGVFVGLFTTLLALSSCGNVESLFVVVDDNVHPQNVVAFYNSDKYDYSDLPSEVNARKDQGDNIPVELSWDLGLNDKAEYTLVFEEKDQTLKYTVVGEKNFSFHNYKLGTEYKFHVEAGGKISNDLEFSTEDGFVRTITVEGVSNFRDLGKKGYLKQGLIYRSQTFENNTISGATYTDITENGLKEIKNLGIKNEIDLRKDSEKGEKAGKIEGIIYQAYPLYYGGQNILTYKDKEFNNPEVIKNLFDFLAVEDNYPLVFHCIRGTDRTGCIAFLLEGLCGISEEFLKKDVIFSNFYNIGSPVKLDSVEYTANPNAETRYLNVIKHEEGDTLAKKIENYLINKIGVSSETLAKIKSILAE